MANRTEDSAMTNLQSLMDLEQQRLDHEAQVRAESDRERARRATEERARTEEMARKRALEAEAARMESEQIRRIAEERVESERMERELRLRLALDQKARAEAQAATLAHQERMARLEASVRKGKVSPAVAVSIAALTLAIVGVAAFAIHQQATTRLEIAAMQQPIPTAVPPVNDNSDLRQRIAELNRRIEAASTPAPQAPATRPAQPPAGAAGNGGHVRNPGNHPPARGNQTPAGYDSLLGEGSDPITSEGLEGGGARRGQR